MKNRAKMFSRREVKISLNLVTEHEIILECKKVILCSIKKEKDLENYTETN